MHATRALVAVLALGLSFSVQALKEAPIEKPLIVAHRGFPSLIPEETIAGYTKAVAAGTDFIEMDIVSTKDGVLVLRHDLTLDDSTDILSHPEFANRNKTVFQPFDKKNQTGFYIADFTLAELRTLYMTQAFKWRDSSLNKMNRIVTLDEILAFGSKVWESDRPVGLYIETKGVEYHDQIGLPLEKKLMQAIARSGLANYSDTAIILQSFELAALPKMKQYGEELGLAIPPLVYLLNSAPTSCTPNITDAELDALPDMGVYFIGPPKDALVGGYVFDPACNRVNSSSPTAGCTSQVNQTCTGRLSPAFAAAYNGSAPFPETLVTRAHKRGLGVHPYTFRNEGQYMALDFNNDPARELDFFGGPNGMGVDGFFGDNAMTMENWWASVTSDGYAENPLTPQYE
jgi:glycerophosphoryl diester phosphodiesterase